MERSQRCGCPGLGSPSTVKAIVLLLDDGGDGVVVDLQVQAARRLRSVLRDDGSEDVDDEGGNVPYELVVQVVLAVLAELFKAISGTIANS